MAAPGETGICCCHALLNLASTSASANPRMKHLLELPATQLSLEKHGKCFQTGIIPIHGFHCEQSGTLKESKMATVSTCRKQNQLPNISEEPSA
eukprot:52348-Amphidinium_carterae.1